MLTVFCSPSRYVQGKNATDALADEMAKFGWSGKVMIIAGKSAAKLLSDTWQSNLPKAGFTVIIEKFSGECSTSEIDRLAQVAAEQKVSVVVGAGGGKVLDTSRAVAARLDLPAVNC
ncbi:MAG TPA: iron-containing alcohol dehydrogenase, partial [Candidatus Obscuribacter sp.]|nr:iron-containing alcohol dehydrogenase [Candidatus Obscuribacter sp.]